MEVSETVNLCAIIDSLGFLITQILVKMESSPSRRYTQEELQKKEGQILMQIIDEEFQNYNLKVKRWAISSQAPPEEISDDLRTVQIAGITWETETDSFNLNHPPLHFGKKVRGRFPSDLKIYRRGVDTIEEFVGDTVLTRRIITSKLMCRFDLLGREVPLTARFKQDLRKLIKFYPLWDQPVSEEF